MILIHLTKKIVSLWHHIIHQVEEETQIWNDANLKVSGILERRERDNIKDQVSSNTQENGRSGSSGRKIKETNLARMLLSMEPEAKNPRMNGMFHIFESSTSE